MLGIQIILSTGLSYIWFGPLPAWLLCLTGLFAILFLSSTSRNNLKVILNQKLVKIVIITWTLFVLIVLVSDSLAGSLKSSFSSVIIYNLVSFAAMIAVALVSMRVKTSDLILLIALLTGLGGILGILQFFGVYWAAAFPDIIASHFSRISGFDLFIDQHYNPGTRVRGIHTLVHKFSAYQGMMVCWLFCLIIGGKARLMGGHFRYIIIICLSMLGGLGAILTFTRSIILGFLCTIVLLLFFLKDKRAIFRILIFSGIALFLIINMAERWGRGEHKRLFDYSKTSSSIYTRLAGYEYAVNAIKRSPLLGEGTTPRREAFMKSIHSVPIRIFTDYGALGVICYLIVIFALSIMFIKMTRVTVQNISLLSLAGLCALLTALIDSATHTSGLMRYDIAQPVLLGVFLGHCLIVYRYYR